MAGRIDKAKGRIKIAAGELTGNQKLKNEGMIDKAMGMVKSFLDTILKILQSRRG